MIAIQLELPLIAPATDTTPTPAPAPVYTEAMRQADRQTCADYNAQWIHGFGRGNRPKTYTSVQAYRAAATRLNS